MPFPKFNFKKSRQQYNVASKSVFVITVKLLDSAVLECTLSAESTGRDCMDNVCQRLNLQQPDLFGLKYVSRRSYPKIRWVDLDRPLKKQLDKYSTEPYLYLGVIFYVTDVSLLEDEVTRYHYFLQLKTDVVEGRLRCNHEQAIVLASYSLQAEFGDHDPEKHTAEYLKDFPLLPKPLVAQFEDRLGALTDPVVAQHASLAGIAQQLAEIYYIVGAQQLEGYGQECFLAKDDAGNEVLLGASLIGICVRKSNGQSPQFKWSSITNLVNHKRYFGIECQDFEYSVQFVFDEPEAAKYVWKMCVLQHTFYKMHQSATESSELNITLSPSTPTLSSDSGLFRAADIANFQRQSQNIPARVELQAGRKSSDPGTVSSYSVSRPGRGAGARRGGGGRGRREDEEGRRRRSRAATTSLSFAPGEALSPLSTSGRSTTDLDRITLRGSDPLAPHQAHRDLVTGQQQGHHDLGLRGSDPLAAPPQGLRDPLAASSNPSHHHHHGLSPQPPVPCYRPAPDYETAVLSKYGPSLYSSHPHLALSPHTYSTPDLPTEEVAPLSLYKPPPPYPGYSGTLFSSSTPDLATHTGRPVAGQVGGSSPDLVSRRTLGQAAHAQSRVSVGAASPGQELHRTYDNLASYEPGNMEYRGRAYSTEELNAVYNLNLEKDIGQAHLLQAAQTELGKPRLLQNIIGEGFTSQLQQSYLYEQQLLQQQQQQRQQQQLEGSRLGGHLAQLDTGQLAQSPQAPTEEGGEPIYQNQGQLLLAQQETLPPTGEGGEPIYQNLPLLEKLQLQSGGSDSDSIQPDDTVEGLSSGKLVEGALPDQQQALVEEKTLVGRVGATTSREDLTQIKGEKPEPRKRLEMRQYLEPAVPQDNIKSLDESMISTVNASNLLLNSTASSSLKKSSSPFPSSTSNPSFTPLFNPTSPSSSQIIASSSSASLLQNSTSLLQQGATSSSTSNLLVSNGNMDDQPTQQPTRSKGRKRWGLNIAGKSGSLKSTKSDKSDGGSRSGEEAGSRGSSGRGMGAMMLANLHGLTRSRPDILAESLANAFNAPAKIPKESIGSFLEAKLAEGEVVREFEKIPKKKTVGCNVSVATTPENIARNRFRDVVPYDENRVKITNDKENKLGYVNASHISATVGDSQRFYIAAQGPMANTVHNFWAMVQECDVHLIVMLTEVSGASKASASIPYWPQNDGSSLELGEFTITKRFSSESGSYTTTTLQLTHGPSKKTRRVWHLQYSGWQDHGCPEDVGEYLTFMEELSALRRHTVSEVAAGKNRNTPVLVHCSAGVGRTGVTILSDILRYCADHNIDIDIPKVLSHLRQQRMLMVQTVAQYKFVHTALIHYLGQSRLI